jgi:eukaryotic-like serine/threonine-protein kinase
MLRLEPGKTLSHYRIIEELGQGGQATAWKAEDTRLNRLVVVKTLLPELAATDAARVRFEREARLLSSLDHPNICTVFDYGENDGLVYMVMPFIPGQTVKQLLAADPGKPLELKLALSLITQVAEALVAAHARGIVHRDIKPSNVIVTEQGQVKVLDFGLAKRVDYEDGMMTDKSVTEVGVPYGSMGYGSPEQATGDRVSQASDIFSLGVLLYEMLTGVPPFTGRNRIEVFHAVINATPRLLRSYAPLVQQTDAVTLANLQRLVERALEKEPVERIPTMVEFRDALRRLWYEKATGQAPPAVIAAELSPVPVPVPLAPKNKRSSWRLTEALGRVLGGSILSRSKAPSRSGNQSLNQSGTLAAGSRATAVPNRVSSTTMSANRPTPPQFFQPAPTLTRPESWGTETKQTIAVVPFKNLSGNSADNYYEFSLADGLITELAHVQSLVVRPSSYVAQYVGQAVDPRQVGEDLAVNAVLTGSFLKTPERFRFNAQLLNAKTGDLMWSDKVDLSSRDLLAMQDTIAERVIDGLKLNLSSEEQQRIEKPLTYSPEAYEFYLRGRDVLFRYTARTFDDGDLDVAIKMFQQALRLDPQFARAHSALGRCYIHHAQGYGGEQYYALAEQSLQRALSLDADLTGARLQMVYVHLHRGEKEKALSLLADVRREIPNDPAVLIAAGTLYRLNGQYEKALKQYDRLLEINPRDLVIAAYNRARIYSYQQRYEEALAALGEGSKLEPEHPLIISFTAVVLFNQGRVKESLAIAQEALRQHSHFDALRVLIARCLSAMGQHEEAQGMITPQVKETAAADYDIAFWLASFYAMEGLNDEAIEWLRHAVKLGNENYPYFARNAKLNNLRDDPRFLDLMNDLRLRWEKRN